MPVVFGFAVIATWLGAMHWSLMLPEGGRQPWRVFIYALIGVPVVALLSAFCLWLVDPTHTNASFASYLAASWFHLVIIAVVGAIAAYRYRVRFYPPRNVARAAQMSDGLISSLVLLAALALAGSLCVTFAIAAHAPDYQDGTTAWSSGVLGTAIVILIFSLLAFFIVRDLKGGDRDPHAGLMAGSFACLVVAGLSYLGALNH